MDQCAVKLSFFAARNVDYLHYAMREGVYRETGMSIGRQSDQELNTIMCSIHAEQCAHLPFDTAGQVAKLNRLVLEYAVPNIVNAMQMHTRFANSLQLAGSYGVMENSAMTSTKRRVVGGFLNF